MIDHVGFGVADYERSKEFYGRALAPLGIELLMEPIARAAGFGRDGKPFFWIEGDRPARRCLPRGRARRGRHRQRSPGPRPIYHQHYYGAYVLDPDANNVEAVCHRPV